MLILFLYICNVLSSDSDSGPEDVITELIEKKTTSEHELIKSNGNLDNENVNGTMTPNTDDNITTQLDMNSSNLVSKRKMNKDDLKVTTPKQKPITDDEKNKDEPDINIEKDIKDLEFAAKNNDTIPLNEEIQKALIDKLQITDTDDVDKLKSKHWNVVIERKDRDNHIKEIKKIEIAVEVLSSVSKTMIEHGTQKSTKTKTFLKTVVARKMPPFKQYGEDTEANKKLLKKLAHLLHINKSVNHADIKKSDIENAKVVEINTDGTGSDELSAAEKFDKEFETVNGGLHILHTIANNLKILKNDQRIKSKIGKITDILIYKHDGIYQDYWDKLTFTKEDNGKYIDETEIFEGTPVDKFEEIPRKGMLSPLGFYQAKEISEDDLIKQFETIKLIIREIAKKKKQNIPELFKDNNKIPIIDRLIFAHAYKNTLPTTEESGNYIKVCVCEDSFCIHPCDQIRWVKKDELE